MSEPCDFPRCRQEMAMTFCGKNLCDSHWAKIADAEGDDETKLLEQVGLMRDPASREVTRKK